KKRRQPKIPQMTTGQKEKFEDTVIRLLSVRWTTNKVADWAASAESGYGRFWESPRDALNVINKICRAINRDAAGKEKWEWGNWQPGTIKPTMTREQRRKRAKRIRRATRRKQNRRWGADPNSIVHRHGRWRKAFWGGRGLGGKQYPGHFESNY